MKKYLYAIAFLVAALMAVPAAIAAADLEINTPAIAALEQTHEQRIATAPDFRSLLADLDSFEKIRTQKKLSLNLKTRVTEREQLEQERLGRENERRKSRNLPPVAKLADLTGQDPPDAVLDETVELAADLSGMSNLYLSRLKAQGERDATP